MHGKAQSILSWGGPRSMYMFTQKSIVILVIIFFLLQEIMALATCCTHSNIEQLVQAVS